MARGSDLYPGSGAADELLYASSMQPVAQGVQQLYQNILAGRQAAVQEGQLALGEDKFAALKRQVQRKQELEDIDRTLGATTYGQGVQTEFGLPDDPGVRARSRRGGYAQDPSYRYGSQAPATTRRTTTKVDPDAFSFDPSGVPTTRSTFGTYEERRAENERQRRAGQGQQRALNERQEAGDVLRSMLGLEADQVIAPERLEEELAESRFEIAGMPDHKEGFYYDDLEGKHRRAVTPKQKAMAARQLKSREDAFWANEQLLNLAEGKYGLVGREDPGATIPVAKQVWGAGPSGFEEYSLPGDRGYEYAKNQQGEWLTRRAGSNAPWEESANLTRSGNESAVSRLEGSAVAKGGGGVPLEPAEPAEQTMAYTTPSSEVYLQELGLLEKGEKALDITSIDEMLMNPAIQVGLDPTYSDTPDQFAHQVWRGVWGRNLDDEDKAQVIEDYKGFYADRLGERQGVIGAERARQQKAHLEALQARADRMLQAQVDVLRKQPAYKKDSEEKLRNIAWANLQDNAAFKATVSDITELRKSQISAAPKHRAVSLDKKQWERETETEDTRVRARLDDATRALVEEYGGVLGEAGIDVTNPDGSFKSPKEIRQKIDVAAGRAGLTGGEKLYGWKKHPQETVNELDALASKLVEAETDAEARREEKIPVPEEEGGAEGGPEGEVTRSQRTIMMRHFSSLEAGAYRKAATQAKLPKTLQDQLLAAEEGINLHKTGTQGYEDAKARLEEYKEKALEYPGFPENFRVQDWLEAGQEQIYREYAGDLDLRLLAKKPEDKTGQEPWRKGMQKGNKVWFKPGPDKGNPGKGGETAPYYEN